MYRSFSATQNNGDCRGRVLERGNWSSGGATLPEAAPSSEGSAILIRFSTPISHDLHKLPKINLMCLLSIMSVRVDPNRWLDEA
jgi:hypothetical protein